MTVNNGKFVVIVEVVGQSGSASTIQLAAANVVPMYSIQRKGEMPARALASANQSMG
jgi:hypothetical protein